ncbi:glycosyltransferase family 4 protein [Treponema zuelzerae]|uniref:Glycosyltransferase family 4 protein n=1 Tax=Teretinema zuelzerae TaxID=156 RepID=A0AAE3EH74_9SPIR|nr:glycosyltransferase family 4 protein [Teretinema zuelzerae]MCD1654654.1 glycosyltransferase family 4 protein [Teretinema zuelzerae]
MTILGLFLNKEIRTGANRRYLELMEGLAEKGNNVIVVMNSLLHYDAASFTKISIPVSYIRKGFPPASFLFKLKANNISLLVKEAIRNKSGQRIDWILIHGDMHLNLAVKLKDLLHSQLFFAYRCNDILRSKYLRESGCLNPVEYSKALFFETIYKAREKKVALYADMVTFQSTSDEQDWISRNKETTTKRIVIPGNIGLPRCSEEWKNVNKSETCKDLLYVGVLSLSKGLFQVFSILKMLKERGLHDIKLTVLGKNDSIESIIAMIRKMEIENSIHFAGYTLPFPYLAESSILVFPSYYDAFPDTVLEALHAGCPVIASNRGGIPDILKNPELMFHPEDVRGMADLLERCIRSKDEYHRIREICSNRADYFRFDWCDRWNSAMMDNLQRKEPR